MSESFAARLKQANKAIKADIDGLEEKADFDYKLKKLIKKSYLLKKSYLFRLKRN